MKIYAAFAFFQSIMHKYYKNYAICKKSLTFESGNVIIIVPRLGAYFFVPFFEGGKQPTFRLSKEVIFQEVPI